MTQSWDLSDPSYSEVGCIGFIIYFPFSLFLAYRLYLSFKEDLGAFKKKNRMIFHSAMLIYAVLEMICLIILWASSASNFVAVCFHFFAMFANIVGFSIVYYCISKLIFRLDSNDQNLVFWAICIFLSIVFLLDVAALFALDIRGEDGNCGFSQVCNNAVMVRDICEGLSLFLLSLGFSVTGYRITKRIFMTQQGFNWDYYLKADNEMLKINVITISCTMFYLLRVFFICMIVDYESSPQEMERVQVFFGVVMTNQLCWFILSKWLTFICPTLMLLHLMRPKNITPRSGGSVVSGAGYVIEGKNKINVVYGSTITSKLHESTQQTDVSDVIGTRNKSSDYFSSYDSENLESETEFQDADVDADRDVLRERQ